MPSSRALLDGNVPLADVAPLMVSVACHLDWASFSTVDRILLAKRWFCVRIWVGLHLWCLDAGLAVAFIELCAAASATLALIAVTATLVSSRWDNLVWLLNCCSSFHWRQILDRIRLERPKKYWRSCCVHDGFVIARPYDQASKWYDASRALGREKWDFPCFPNFI